MTDPLAGVSDATMALAGFWCLVGWVTGFAFAVAIFWSKIRKTADGVLRLLRYQVDDDAEHLRQLYAMNDRLGRKLIDAEARNAELVCRLTAAREKEAVA